jgi:putative PIN family toxin of toxin-antitoxin system
MRIVLDTNVLVSGLLNPNGSPAAVLNLVVNSKIQLLYDNRILQEYMEVLHRDKFGFSAESIDALMVFFQDEGEYVSAEPTSVDFADNDDRMFYEVMVTAKADYLITGNQTHFPKEAKIKNPRAFVSDYEKQ